MPEKLKHRILADMSSRDARGAGQTYRAMQQALAKARLSPETKVLYVTYNEAAAQHLREQWKAELALVPNLTINSIETIYANYGGKKDDK
jgi:hypothetical protein